jgi:hypothetical protein
MRFSQRMGLAPVRSVLQTDNIDAGLRNKLWNVVERRFQSTAFTHSDYLPNDAEVKLLFLGLWHDFFKVPTDTLSSKHSAAVGAVREYFFKCKWHEVYDLLEILANSRLAYGLSGNYGRRTYSDSAEFIAACNQTLKEEMSGFRFVSGRLLQITGEDEVTAIEQALALSDPLKPVTEHLRQALTLLADRKDPDYRNSIKESILAVESLCKLIAGLPKATLGPALTAIEKATALHPSLKEAFLKLYGYTSDAEGIRHALIEESTLDLEDAKFMLVSCSAFINYIVVKAQKARIAL